jgi:hypothetical protein
LCKIEIYNSEDAVSWTDNNEQAHNEYIAEQKRMEIQKQDSISRKDESSNEKTNIIYNKQDIKKQLDQLQKEAESLEKKDKHIHTIIEKADRFIRIFVRQNQSNASCRCGKHNIFYKIIFGR